MSDSPRAPLQAEDQLVLSTVRLVVPLKEPRDKERVGTGFFFRCDRSTGGIALIIITNTHVLRGGRELRFSVVTADQDGLPRLRADEEYVFTELEESWGRFVIEHPDPAVDLCAIVVSAVAQALGASGIKLGNRVVPSSFVVSDEHEQQLTAIEQILTIGYPDGRWDSVNNRPIVRRGITATPATIDYEGRREFVIDAACFGGMSGSPVYLMEEGLFDIAADKPLHQRRFRLLGVLTEELPPRVEKGTLTNVFPTTESGAVSEYEVPLHLGVVIKASRVRELCAAVDMRLDQVRPPRAQLPRTG